VLLPVGVDADRDVGGLFCTTWLSRTLTMIASRNTTA
jgi:hypothetical protein